MSVHDDGPARWEKKTEPAQLDAGAESAEPFPNAEAIATEAGKLLASYVDAKASFTSLDFKKALRIRCADIEPTPVISQEDCSKYLKRWFLDAGTHKDGYTFIEKPALDRDGNPKPDKTVYNVYTWAPPAPPAPPPKDEVALRFEEAAKDPKAAESFLDWVRSLVPKSKPKKTKTKKPE